MKSPKELFESEVKLSEYSGEDRVISSHEIFEELSKTEESMFKVPTGVPALDRILGQTEAGELIILTGPTGEGKTTLAITITRNIAYKGILSLWFTLEVTPRQFIKKIIGKIQDIKHLPLFYMPSKNTDNQIKWIEERIIEAKSKYDVRVVFIDHIHQIFSLDKMRFSNVSLELGDLVGRIKQIAIEQNLVIFLIAHTKDDPQGSTTKEPGKESIRDSGLISRLADSIIAVWRIPTFPTVSEAVKLTSRRAIGEKDNWAKVRVLKNRRDGVLGTAIMECKDHYFTELDIKKEIEAEDAEMDLNALAAKLIEDNE
jgi:replicative DNA helicase